MQQNYKINSQISAPQVRLIGEDGRQIGIFSKEEALDYALGQGVDLVLIGEKAVPPVAKAIDYKKFVYQQEKKDREAKKSQKASGVKEIRVGGPFAGEADVAARIKRTEEFLTEGYNVRVSIKFTGRQMGRTEFGHRILNQFKVTLGDKARVDREIKMEGRQLTITFASNKQ